MQYGMSEVGFPHEDLDRSFECLAAAGYHGVEIKVTEDRLEDPTQLDRLQDLAREHDLTIPIVIANAGQGGPLGHPDEDIRGDRVETATDLIAEVSRTLDDVETILVVPGGVSEEIPYDTAYENARRSLETIDDVAADHGVNIGIENVWNRFLLSPLEFASFIDDVSQRGAVGAYFDVGNVMQYGYPQQWIDILGERIEKIHVKDFQADIGNIRGFTYPTQGDVPWDAVRDSLHELSYDGWITVEVSPYPTNPHEMPAHVLDNLKDVFS